MKNRKEITEKSTIGVFPYDINTWGGIEASEKFKKQMNDYVEGKITIEEVRKLLLGKYELKENKINTVEKKAKRKEAVEFAYTINTLGGVEPSSCFKKLMNELIEGKITDEEIREIIIRYYTQVGKE